MSLLPSVMTDVEKMQETILASTASVNVGQFITVVEKEIDRSHCSPEATGSCEAATRVAEH